MKQTTVKNCRGSQTALNQQSSWARWVGQRPESCCLLPSRSKNSNRDQSQNACQDWPDFIRFFFFFHPDGCDSSPSSGIKTKGEIRPGSRPQLRVQAAMYTTVQVYGDSEKKPPKKHTNTHMNHAQEARKHAGCIPCRPVQYREKKRVYLKG